MKKHLFLAATAAVLAVPALADQVRVQERKVICTTSDTGSEKKVTCTDENGAPTSPPPHVVMGQHPGSGQDDVNVEVTNNGGDEQRVIIIRRSGMDGADANKDGKISRKEFLARAEKHFDELDKNHDGVLEGEEMHPPMPPLPPGVGPLPPMPPAPPVPPVPPVPPLPEHH